MPRTLSEWLKKKSLTKGVALDSSTCHWGAPVALGAVAGVATFGSASVRDSSQRSFSRTLESRALSLSEIMECSLSKWLWRTYNKKVHKIGHEKELVKILNLIKKIKQIEDIRSLVTERLTLYFGA